MKFKNIDEIQKEYKKRKNKGLSPFCDVLPGDFELGAEVFNNSISSPDSSVSISETYYDRNFLISLLKKYSRHSYNFDKLSDGALRSIYNREAEEINQRRLADDVAADRKEHDKEMDIWRKEQAKKKELAKNGEQISIWDK